MFFCTIYHLYRVPALNHLISEVSKYLLYSTINPNKLSYPK